ncbi:MAG: L-glutamate gamma-semialdehyde dehydrogenase [Acidobacteriota bacterium]
MPNGIVPVPTPINEPVRDYAPGSPEKHSLKTRLDAMLGERPDIPIIIGGEEIRTGRVGETVCPHDHGHVLATFHQAGPDEVARAIQASQDAWHGWSAMAWEDRAAVFLKAAELLAGPWRDTLNAATMLNQSKTVFQAEIDSACELIDFWRFNPHYMRQMYTEQPISSPGLWNQVEYRALEGFIFAVAPFNFTSIAGNLPTAPAMMGNTVLWKPASTAILSAYHIMRLLEAAGLPPGVINFLPGPGPAVGDPTLASPLLAGVHFTGSTGTFQRMWRTVGANVADYASYPRLVGETGGKDFIFAHASADVDALVTALVRGAFEYQGQKCSAASRAYIPKSLWPTVRERLADVVGAIRMGSPVDFRNFMAAVIDAKSFATQRDAIEGARASADAEILVGGGCDDSTGYFVEPTVIVTTDPRYPTMRDELFGPVLTIYVYDDADLDEALHLCDTATTYSLTGAIFARDRGVIAQLAAALRHSAGNFYVNDKPTGAVVGQQPFGGGRASGTNDKAGSVWNLLRWTSQRSIKETFVSPIGIDYPHMGEA